MGYELKLAWRHIRSRPVQTAITVTVIALAIALPIAVTLLSDGVQRGIVRASDPFGVLVVGAKGDAQQMVLSTVLLQGTPIGNIPYSIYEQLRADPRVALAVPIAMGDNVGGARIIGTTSDLFTLRPSLNEPPAFRLLDGRLFQANFEAVLGYEAALALGLGIGDQFFPSHGVERGLESDEHELPHTVVGILEPSHSPYDRAVFVTLESVWAVHEDEEETGFGGETAIATDPSSPTAQASDNTVSDHDQITAVLVKPTGFIEANELWRELRLNTMAQAAFPGKELGGLFDLLRQGQRLLNTVGYLAAIMAALTVLLAMYSAIQAREQAIAIMRALGASRMRIFRIILYETLLVAWLGAVFGRLLGYGAAVSIALAFAQQSAIPVSIRYLPQIELLFWVLPLGLGGLAGLVPAILAYRVNVVAKLFPV
ncbi:MAG: ABC transporter permease [Anaerolineae bacterium]|nr:ABC transporter permease [Anaerolineae bacterium]MDW8098515.1 ABC transporter permease [Anaerolineae bacterium]